MKDASPRAIRLVDYQLPAFLIDKTNLRLELNDDFTTVRAELFMRRNPDAKAQDTLILDGCQLDLQSIAINGRALGENDYQVEEESLRIHQVPAQFTLTTECRIRPQDNTALEGLYKSRTLYCTQCEAEGFRRITYYLDRPDVMSEFTTTLVADKRQFPVLLANGNPVDSGELENGRHWQTWHDPFKKPAYLFAAVAGDLAVIEDQFTTRSGRDVQIRIYVEEKDLNKCDHALNSLKNAMKWDEEVYGREYDLDIFMIVAVDDFNMGAMENKGLNIFNTSCVLAQSDITTDAAFQRVESVVAHEYFHNWSGNRVTCRDWFQLSLKEGFTVFRDAQFSADMGSPVSKRVGDVALLRTHQFAEDAGPMAHPVQPSSYIEISNFYTFTIYEKGAEIVRMLHALLGAELFRKGSDLYFERHDGQAVTIDDFVKAMADASGRDLSQFKRWYVQAGTPVLQVTDQYDPQTQRYTLSLRQHLPGGEKQLPLHIPVAVGLVGEKGELPLSLVDDSESARNHRVLELREAEQDFVFTGITEKPVPSLLRNFSAPARLQYNYSRDDLLRLMQFDSDGFNRWDASQMLASDIIQEWVEAYPNWDSLAIDSRLAEIFATLLRDDSLDPTLLGLMLQIPSEAYLSEQADCIRVDAIHQVRNRLRLVLAQTLKAEFEDVYQRLNHAQVYEPSARQIAHRSLKNTALGYLALLNDSAQLERSLAQYQNADNMTDRLAALSAILNIEEPCIEQVNSEQTNSEQTNSEHAQAETVAADCLADFYQRFQQEALAMDQWFAVQASCQKPGALDRVKSLLKHPGFQITNPNKVRALIGTFCNQNLVNFHALDGSGYAFLGKQIRVMNALNPQMASRLLTPLTRWRKYEPAQQALMKAELQNLQAMGDLLSKDVYEVVNKSLAE